MDEPAVRNEVSGTVFGAVVQTNAVHGGLHIHQPEPPRVVPRQLPAMANRFVGRASELAELDTGGDAGISVIGGPGGIGKTWLAVHWAREHADRFPDGQLFADLRGFSPDSAPMPPEVALRGFLSALGVPSPHVPADPHAQAALFRSLTADRRLLVILDNARDSAQVSPLLPGGDRCRVLITSRDRLAGLTATRGARYLRADVLSDVDAHALLSLQFNTSGPVGELARLCGGFPLALSIIATRSHLDVAELVADLREAGLDALDDGDPAASLPAVFSWSYQALPADQARAFGLLGIAPGADIGPHAAARLLDQPVSSAKRLLRSLVDASLAGQTSSGRYEMHDLLRQDAIARARKNMPEADRDAALRRVVEFYNYAAQVAEHALGVPGTDDESDQVRPGWEISRFDDQASAMAWFDAEYHNLLAAQHVAVGHGWHEAVWRFAWNLVTYRERRGRTHDSLADWAAALAAAEQLGNNGMRCTAHRFYGNALAELRQYDDALDHLRRALDLSDDRLANAETRRTLAWIYGQQGDFRQALDQATVALTTYRQAGDRLGEAIALNATGWYTAHLGDHERARQLCTEALVLNRLHHNRDDEANALDNLGYIAHHTGAYAEAIERYHQALALHRELDDTYFTALTLEQLAFSHNALGQHEHAVAACQEALRLYLAQNCAEDAARVQNQLDALGPR
ncbi:tetratricopeptide repeat protein [Actinocrispum sp. NPDC049592]|uniref:ATP-binding protein n=1 Tax=Actinocrispum sp. NPDC049592 TaxID=3154835 RepID=UPI0034356F35